jgi:adenylate cyclase
MKDSIGVSTLLLTISGGDPPQQRHMDLKEGAVVRIGRAAPNGIPWDLQISRQHAELRWDGEQLRATCLAAARNPMIYHGESTREVILRPGEAFSIGETNFQFTTAPDHEPSGTDTVQMLAPKHRGPMLGQHTYSEQELRQYAFRDKEQQLELLSRLPGMISESQSDTELGQMLCGLLMAAVPQAEAVAVANYDMAALPEDEASIDNFPKPLTKRVRVREEFSGRFRPSRRIILKTLREQTSVLHIWPPDAQQAAFTTSDGLGWAVCVPIRGDSCHGWCMYVSGKGARDGGLILSEADLASDVRFTELVAQFIGSVRQVRVLQEQKTRLSSFFSPKVIDSLTAHDGADALSPAERNITVLFCDIRGFSRKAEQLQHDLLPLLRSVKAALGVMVSGILERDGAIADLQGDAALGFWGWPVALEYGPVPACRAALRICEEFRRAAAQADSLLHGFSVGIGIAHGRAVAGQIGTDQQSKIGVFGPVVNQGARLEGLTKQFDVSICIDGPTAEFVDRYVSSSEGRLRPLARVRPKGMGTPIDVFNLLPAEQDHSEVSQKMITDHEAALEAVTAGKWDNATELLTRLPNADGPRRFLIRQMEAFRNSPPSDWDGVFSLARK